MMDKIKYDKLVASIKDVLYTIFRMYDMDKGEANEKRMKAVLEFCKNDLINSPALVDMLDYSDKTQIKAFVVQSILYMI